MGAFPLFPGYVEEIGFYRLVSGIILSVILKSNKGLQLLQLIKQNLAFFMEGTHMAISGFDQIKEGPFLIDALFREGSAHCDYGTDYIDRVRAVVELIRKRYSSEVPIVLCSDSGFFDQKAFGGFEQELHIHIITTGKLYNDMTEYVQDLPTDAFNTISKNKVVTFRRKFCAGIRGLLLLLIQILS